MLLVLVFPSFLLALDCDCQVTAFSPLTGSVASSPHVLEFYKLESFSKNTESSQALCRNLCLRKFHQELPVERLGEVLKALSETLIDQRAVGYNCTGLTTLKFPIRVKASLGKTGLGNVEDFIQVINLESSCF